MNDSQRASKTNPQIQVRQHLLTRLPGLLVITMLPLSTPALANDLPTGGQVVAGSGNIQQADSTMTVNQNTQNMVINWDSFNVGAGHTVNFVQPAAQAAVLNRVMGADVSVIQGAINANGRVFLVNPNGVLFTPTAQVNVGSMVASTLNISTADFMSGSYRFEGSTSNAIINQGNITAVGDGSGGGTVALIAARISNPGTISAHQGNVLAAAGQKVTLDLGGPVKIQVDQGTLGALIEQGGAIRAHGGLVYLTAKAAGTLASTVINHTGVTEAQTLQTGESGQIYLMGGMTNDRISVGGTLDASAPVAGDGGFIETSAATVEAAQGRTVTTRAANGKTGTYLIDPIDYTVAASGGNITGAQLGADLALNDVVITTASGGGVGNGDIFVNDELSWSNHTLTLVADRNIDINARMQGTDLAKLSLQYGQGGAAAGNAAQLTIHASVGLPEGNTYSTRLGNDGTVKNYTVITQLGSASDLTTGTNTLYGMGANANLGSNFALGGDIDAITTLSGAPFQPIGSPTNPFTGSFDGLGHEISNLRIGFQADGTGLFGDTSNTAQIANVGLPNARVEYVWQEQRAVGALVGHNRGSIVNSYATGDVCANTFTGGLVGWNEGSIARSYFSGYVSAGNRVGALVGVNTGTIINTYATGQVVSSFSQDLVGGLVGQNSGTIGASYAAVSVSNSSTDATGRFAGWNGGIITDSYWDSSTFATHAFPSIGAGTQSGALALSAAQMKQGVSFSGWDFSETWYAQDGYSAPLLRAFLKPLTISAKDAVKTYDAQVYNDPNGLNFAGHTSVDRSQLLGTLSYGTVSLEAPDAADAPYALSVSGLYSAQQGYMINYAPGGFLTVNRAALNLEATKTYDGTTTFAADLFTSEGLVNGVAGQSLRLTGAATVASKDVQIADDGRQTLTNTGTLALLDNTGKASNYTLVGGSHGGTITRKTVTATGAEAADKFYDGNTTAVVNNTTLSGLVAGEGLVVNASGVFSDANVGLHNVLVSYELADKLASGGKASNYVLAATTGATTANINARPAPAPAPTPANGDTPLTPRPNTAPPINEAASDLPAQLVPNPLNTVNTLLGSPSANAWLAPPTPGGVTGMPATSQPGMQNTGAGGPTQSGGLVFVPAGSSPGSSELTGLVPVFMVDTGVNFGNQAPQ